MVAHRGSRIAEVAFTDSGTVYLQNSSSPRFLVTLPSNRKIRMFTGTPLPTRNRTPPTGATAPTPRKKRPAERIRCYVPHLAL